MSSYKILILDTYYPAFLRSFYAKHPGLERQPYREQWRALMDQCFGTADFYSFNLKKLGHEAEEIVVNCEPLQRQWAREHGVQVPKRVHAHGSRQHGWDARTVLRAGIRYLLGRRGSSLYARLKAFRTKSFPRRPEPWVTQILTAQIKRVRPDILYVQELGSVDDDFLGEVKPYARLLIGQIATLLPPDRHFDSYDLIVSSLPNLVDYFGQIGIPSEYLKLGFGSSVLAKLSNPPRICRDTVHVGGYGHIHQERNALLETLAKQFDIEFWGYSVDHLTPDSLIRRNYRGQAWGVQMYEVRQGAKITVTKHITKVASRFCNNSTLYEATGVGTLLITDLKDNLHELFEPGKEIVAYRSSEECVELVQYYLEHDNEREAIARAGQQRTLREHTYYQRMQELVDILERHLSTPKALRFSARS